MRRKMEKHNENLVKSIMVIARVLPRTSLQKFGDETFFSMPEIRANDVTGRCDRRNHVPATSSLHVKN